MGLKNVIGTAPGEFSSAINSTNAKGPDVAKFFGTPNVGGRSQHSKSSPAHKSIRSLIFANSCLKGHLLTIHYTHFPFVSFFQRRAIVLEHRSGYFFMTSAAWTSKSVEKVSVAYI